MKLIFLILSLLVNPYGREALSLNGTWSAILDPSDVGEGKRLYTDARPEGKTDFVEFSYDGALSLEVPGDWNHQDAQFRWYEGTVWYARHFQAAHRAGHRRILYFAGVSQRCDVYLNGERVAVHEGSFTPFQAVMVSIPDLKVRQALVTDADGVARGVFRVKGLRRWQPLRPSLYAVTVSSGTDTVTERIGFRDIAVDGTKILVNGEPTFLKCISFHEEIPMEQRRAWSPEDAEVLVGAAADLGCNAIRLAHYPQNEYIVRLAEEKGLLVWEEIPLWQSIDFTSEETWQKAETYLREMIGRDRNRCAIGLWSISNETRPGPERDAFLTRLLALGRSLDDSRLFTSAFDVAYYRPEADEFRMEDGFAGQLDVIGINKYMGWYAPWPKPAAELRWNVFPDKPLVISEFGCEARAGVYGDADTASSWSEDYQVALYRDNLVMFGNIPNLAGVSPWVLYDFLSPFRQHPVNQGFFNRKGILSDRGERKRAWYVMNKYYKER